MCEPVLRGQGGGRETNRLTCRGLTSQDTVNWFAKGSAVGSCPPLSAGSSSDSCTPDSGPLGEVFRPSRTSNAQSVLNVDPVVYGSTVVERGGSLECRIAGGIKPIAAVRWIMSVSSLTAAVDGSQCLSCEQVDHNMMMLILRTTMLI